jgi:hypothetical protein
VKTHFKFHLALLLLATMAANGRSQDSEIYELPPINYSHSEPNDAVSHLKRGLVDGDLKLEGTDREIVEILLRKLHIPITSQLLVFSKTSFQNDRISPTHPRVLYFTDNCYVGWVPGGLVEIAAIDATLGPIFYSFDPRAVSEKREPQFSRNNDCMRCHGSHFVSGIPALFARSVYADQGGEPLYRQGTEVVDFRTPFSQRWGGWYVTGTHGNSLHRGNSFASETEGQLAFEPRSGANVTNLSSFFNPRDYLTNGSDIVALLVFEQQLAVQNAITRAGMNCRKNLDYQAGLEEALKEPRIDGEPHYDSVRHVFDHCAEEVLDNLLFKDEADLPENITGSPAFQRDFSASALRAHDGSSLKDLLVSEHLFKNRCSYLIYSDSFLSLPPALKRRIYARLTKALSPDQPDPRYTYIHRSERLRIAIILRETHPEIGKDGLAQK